MRSLRGPGAFLDSPRTVGYSAGLHLISFVLPTLDEELSSPIASLADYLGARSEAFELLVVDDSRGERLEKARAAVESAVAPPNGRFRFFEGPHAGKGAAVRRGILESEGDVVFLMDVDLPVPLEFVGTFLQHIADNADGVIAERPTDREFVTRFRWALSFGLRVFQRALLFHSSRYRDTQCGFKAFRGPLIREIARQQIVEGGMYDLEYLYVAGLYKTRIDLVTVRVNSEIRESRINVWKCLRRDPIDVARVKLHGLRGAYGDPRSKRTGVVLCDPP